MPRPIISATVLIYALGTTSLLSAQSPVTQPDKSSMPPPVQLTAQQDHQRIEDLLHITSLRPGANGNHRPATNVANYDESKADPYPDLPDPLILQNRQKVTTAAMWWNQRRPGNRLEEFDREIYGRVPKNTPTVKWEVTGMTNAKNGDVPVLTKETGGPRGQFLHILAPGRTYEQFN